MPTTWEIVEMYQNPYDRDSLSTDPNALYGWTLKSSASNRRTNSSIFYFDVRLLMRHFKVTQATRLVGMHFESQSNLAPVALGRLLLQIKYGQAYSPPSAEKIRQRLLAPLICLEIPDFSDFDDESVVSAFLEVWDGQSAKKHWLDKLKRDIKFYSGNQVELHDADPHEFSRQVNGPAEYLILTYQGRNQKLILAPSTTPIIFD